MRLIGLTGGIGSGKSTTCKFFAKEGCAIVDCDKLAHEQLLPGTKAYKQLLTTFGDGILEADSNKIDREALGKIVFADAVARRKLNKITQMATFLAIVKAILRCWWQGDNLVILDMPLLYETKIFTYIVKCVVVVWVDENTQLERLMARNPTYSEEHALQRINAQMPLRLKKAKADHVIDNTGDQATLQKQVTVLCAKLRSTWRTGTHLATWMAVVCIATGLVYKLC